MPIKLRLVSSRVSKEPTLRAWSHLSWEHYKYDFTFKVFANLILHLGSGVSFVPLEQGLK